jgi:acyl-CoA thioester hydrolase
MTHAQLAGFPVILEMDVAWGDMDSFGHVNNVVYFRYFENARVDYLTRVGWFDLMKSDGIGPIVASAQTRFRKPLKYPDRIHVGARIVTIEADRVTFEHRIISQAWDDLAAEGQAVVVCLDYSSGKKVSLPEGLLTSINWLESN